MEKSKTPSTYAILIKKCKNEDSVPAKIALVKTKAARNADAFLVTHVDLDLEMLLL